MNPFAGSIVTAVVMEKVAATKALPMTTRLMTMTALMMRKGLKKPGLMVMGQVIMEQLR